VFIVHAAFVRIKSMMMIAADGPIPSPAGRSSESIAARGEFGGWLVRRRRRLSIVGIVGMGAIANEWAE